MAFLGNIAADTQLIAAIVKNKLNAILIILIILLPCALPALPSATGWCGDQVDGAQALKIINLIPKIQGTV
jgi:hypothetical protein